MCVLRVWLRVVEVRLRACLPGAPAVARLGAIDFRFAYVYAYDIDGAPFISAIGYPNIPALVAKHGIGSATLSSVLVTESNLPFSGV